MLRILIPLLKHLKLTDFPRSKPVDIAINGENRSVSAKTVKELLESLDIDSKRVAVELNMEILPKADYVTRTIADGDRIEIVHFVGGG
jgi:sulfur carrier protein